MQTGNGFDYFRYTGAFGFRYPKSDHRAGNQTTRHRNEKNIVPGAVGHLVKKIIARSPEKKLKKLDQRAKQKGPDC